jgi:two-component system cell cycle response regulator
VFSRNPSTFLIASPDPALLGRIEPVLTATGVPVRVVLSLESALNAIAGPEPPTLVLLDVNLPATDPELNIDRLLAAGCSNSDQAASWIVVIADTVTQHWVDRLAEGVIEDLIPRNAELAYWRLRVEMALRHRQRAHELETFREAAARNAQIDRLTGVYNRETIVSMLFRETDRVQRQSTALSLVVMDVDGFSHWNTRLGHDICDDLLCQVAARLSRALRSYDQVGRLGMDEFLLILPGCSAANAALLADRLRIDVFARPFSVGRESIRLTASFGVTCSQGRSPVVVLREGEQALQAARAAGPESIQCYADLIQPREEPILAAASSGDGLWNW